MRLKPDWFLLGMAGAVALAWAWPGPGATGGWLQPQLLNKVGIALIFLLHGAALPLAALRAGTLQWPVHLLVQLSTFLLFPLLGILGWVMTEGRVDEEMRIGFLYLCALPSTVSSSVALTAAARGNVPVAVFNATLSSLLGIVLTPLWLSLVVRTGHFDLPLGDVVWDLVKWLLVPFAVGQLLRPLIGGAMQRHRGRINRVDRGTILVLVYTSFADSFARGLWAEHGWGTVLAVSVVCAGLLALVIGTVRAVARRGGFPMEDQIAAIFCGSKKSLASGVPMAQIIFAGHPAVGVILLPIMIYHSLQLIVGGWLAGRWAARP